MTQTIKRVEAIRLRKQGKSYSQIKEVIGVSKSTLSTWLRDYPLDKSTLQALRKNDGRIEKYRETMRLKRQNKLANYYAEQSTALGSFTKRDLFLTGLFLYWGEGDKASRHRIGIYNTDPAMIKFGLLWLTKSLKIPKEKVRIHLHLYSDMNVENEISFWQTELKVQRNQFTKPYIKKTLRESIDHKGFGHGTCSLTVSDTETKDRLMMTLQSILDTLFEKY